MDTIIEIMKKSVFASDVNTMEKLGLKLLIGGIVIAILMVGCHELMHFLPNRKKTKDNRICFRSFVNKDLFHGKNLTISLSKDVSGLASFRSSNLSVLNTKELKRSIIMGPIVDLIFRLFLYSCFFVFIGLFFFTTISSALIFGIITSIGVVVFMWIKEYVSPKKGSDMYRYKHIEEYQALIARYELSNRQ